MAEFNIERLFSLPPGNISTILTPDISGEIHDLIEGLDDDEHYNRFFAVRYGSDRTRCFHCQDFMAKTLPIRHLLVLGYDKQNRALAGFHDVYITGQKTAVMAGIVGAHYRRQGLGSILVHECFDTLKQIPNLETVELDVLYSNSAAHHMAEKIASQYPYMKKHEFGVTNYKFRLTQEGQ